MLKMTRSVTRGTEVLLLEGKLIEQTEDYVKIDERYFRPTEVDYLLSDPSKAFDVLGWKPKVRYHDLVRIMVDADLELLGLEAPGEGKRIVEERFGSWHRWEDQVVSMDK